MGYIENLRDECLEKLMLQLKEAKEKNSSDFLFQADLSLVSFSCGFIDGCKLIRKLNSHIKIIQKTKQQMEKIINETLSNLDLKTEQGKALSNNEKKNFNKEIKKILLNLTHEECERLRKLKKIKHDILLHICNSFLYVLSGLLFVGFGSLLYLNNVVISAIVYPISVIAILGFVAIQILYTVKYLKAIKSTIRGTIDFGIKRTFSTLLVVWWYVAILTFVNHWDGNILNYSFAAIFVFYIVFIIYDLLLCSGLLDDAECTISLIAAIIIGIVHFTDSIDNEVVKSIGIVLLLCACLLLHVLIIKKFMLDKKQVRNIFDVLNVVYIVIIAVVLTIIALYKFLWIAPREGQVADNTLFSSVIGVYAAIIGGGLTLAGVAWTIQHGEQLRKDEERKRFEPLFTCKYIDWNNSKTKREYTRQIRLNNDEVPINSEHINIRNFCVENTSKVEFFLCGIYINGSFIKTQTKELIRKDQLVYFDNIRIAISAVNVEEIKLSVADLIDNYYTTQLEFDVSNHIVTIKGNKSLQLAEKPNE